MTNKEALRLLDRNDQPVKVYIEAKLVLQRVIDDARSVAVLDRWIYWSMAGENCIDLMISGKSFQFFGDTPAEARAAAAAAILDEHPKLGEGL